MLSKTVFFLYGILWDCIYLLAGILSFFSEKARCYVRNPAQISRHIESLRKIAESNQKRVFIYCSSAGEYEQALPIAVRLIDQGWFVHFGFFSFSGSYYAHKRKDQHSYFQHLTDHPRYWKKVFNAFRPQLTLVVRHELWPAFVKKASEVSVLGLVDLSRPKAEKNFDKVSASYFKRAGVSLHRWMLDRFSRLYCVSEKDREFFAIFFPSQKLRIVGDTKYDRVWERANGALKSPEAVAKLDEVLGWIQAKASDAVESDAGSMLIDENARKEARKLLVVGSAWPEDLELILKGASLIPKFWSSSNLLVVPHDIRKASVDKMAELLANYGMKARVYLKTDENSNLSAETITPDPRPTALILNSMGFLAECYKLADGVWVGGAVAGKIHNVLEPAVFMKNIAHGQNFQSQVEATLLVEKGLSTVVKTPEEFRDWWQSLDADLGPSHSPSSVQAKLRDFMFKNLGASKRIVEDVLQLVESK